MLFLKQSTAVTVNIGPFIDDTDGKTAEVALTEHPADILLAKNGGDFAAKNEASNCTHDNLGWYHCPIDVTDTNTLGRLQLHCHEAGFLPVFHEYMVLPANIYDSLVSGAASDYLDVNVITQSNIDFGALQKTSLETAVDDGLDNAIPAVNTVGSVNDVLKDHLQSESDTIVTAAATAAAYSIVNSGLGFRGIVTAIPGADQFTIATLLGIGAGTFADATSPWFAYVLRDAGGAAGAPQGEYRQVTAYNSGTGAFTTNAFTAAVAVGDDIIITSNAISNIISILADTNELQTDWTNGGRLDLLLDEAINDILAVDGKVDTIDNYVDLEVAAIKAVTDTLSLANIADAVLDEVVDTNAGANANSLRENVNIIASALAGKLSGAGTGTLTFRDLGDTKARITATVDANNNRTAVVQDGT